MVNNGGNVVNNTTGTMLPDGRRQVTGDIIVTNAPVTISFQTFGGAGSVANCYTNSEFITVGIQYAAEAIAYETNIQQATINTNGTFAYVLRGEFGCSSGNYARID